MPKVFTSKTQKIGELGEEIACKYLINKGFTVVERNYTKKWGEIDIIAEKKGKLHLIEVKAVSCVTLPDVSHETTTPNRTSSRSSPYKGEEEIRQYRPEENLHPQKMRRLLRTVQTYMMRKDPEVEWQVDLYCVYIQLKDRVARVKVLENLVG